MDKSFFIGNRQRFAASMKSGSVAILLAGREISKTHDEYYPFFAQRNFVYLTGILQKNSILVICKDSDTSVSERLYILPGDAMAERWTGMRLTAQEASEISGVSQIRSESQFLTDLQALAISGSYENLYLDLFRYSADDIDTAAHGVASIVQKEYPFLNICNANTIIRSLRTVKQPCEIAALRQAEKITGAGILAMMKASKPGMFEYQYKAEFDRAIGQFGPAGPGFPSIISAGSNNFCIHYYSYTGQAKDGDMILNDVGAQYDNLITDVSRGFPCNGKFTDRQKLLYECALQTSDYMFSIIRPGMKMKDVDATIRSYNAQLLKDAGVLKDVSDVGTYMWHGGAHHIGFDCHDAIAAPEIISPNMVFCVDVGIYHEEWGIGFRVEDNCLVTETGCENLSGNIPRTVADIEAVMGK
ncbi:MAG: aminopeptidase P N-terminal domain-containing protein [Lachnospiraceae bacterium]